MTQSRNPPIFSVILLRLFIRRSPKTYEEKRANALDNKIRDPFLPSKMRLKMQFQAPSAFL